MSTTAPPAPNANASQPAKWWNIYSNPTEEKVLREMARGNHEWRTSSGIAKKTRLTEKQVETVILKFLPTGVVQSHSKEPKYRYWERASKKRTKKGSIAGDNQKRRIKDASAQQNPTP